MSPSMHGEVNRRQTTTGCALAATVPKPSPLPRFSEPCSPVLDETAHRRTSSLGTIPLSSATARKPSRLGPSRTSEAGSMESTRRQTVMDATAPASSSASTAGKPSATLLRARSANDHPSSWSIHAFDASSACSSPASCPATPAAQTPAGAPTAPDTACPSATISASTGQPLASPCHPAAATPSTAPTSSTNEAPPNHRLGRRHTVANCAPATSAARPLCLLGRMRSLNARQDPASFAVEATSAGTSACSTPGATSSTAADEVAQASQAGCAAADGTKRVPAVALGQPCTALMLAPSVRAIIVAQAPLGVGRLASSPFSQGPTLDMELSPEEVLWVVRPPALCATPADAPRQASGRHGLVRRLLHRLLGRLSCMARPAVAA